MKYLSFLFLCLIIFTPPGHAYAETNGDAKELAGLVPKIIMTYGGERSLEKIGSFSAEGRIDAVAFGDQGEYSLHFKREKKLRVDIKYRKSSEHRILDGDKGYYGTDNKTPARVEGSQYLAILYQYKSMDIPYSLLKGRYKVSLIGKTKIDGAETAVLMLRDEEGPPIKIYVDLKSFHIVRTSGFFAVDDAMTALSSEFSDFINRDGTVFPRTITNYANGQKIAVTRIRTYKINPAINDSIFRPGRTAKSGAKR